MYASIIFLLCDEELAADGGELGCVKGGNLPLRAAKQVIGEAEAEQLALYVS
jgi:hypothetical protein